MGLVVGGGLEREEPERHLLLAVGHGADALGPVDAAGLVDRRLRVAVGEGAAAVVAVRARVGAPLAGVSAAARVPRSVAPVSSAAGAGVALRRVEASGSRRASVSGGRSHAPVRTGAVLRADAGERDEERRSERHPGGERSGLHRPDSNPELEGDPPAPQASFSTSGAVVSIELSRAR